MADVEDKDSLSSRVKNWMVKTGFPLEMRVAKAFPRPDWDCWQSGFYRDAETGKHREIDVVARTLRYAEPKADTMLEFSLYVVIECKSDLSHPWVVLKGKNYDHFHMGSLTMGTPRAMPLFNKTYQPLKGSRVGALAANAGTGVTKAFSKGGGNDFDSVYEALFQAFKAAEAKILQSYKDDRSTPPPKEYRHFEMAVVLPTVVITAPLFEGFLDDAGELVLREVEQAAVVFRYPKDPAFRREYRNYPGACIYIIREPALPDYVKAVSEFSDILETGLPALIDPTFMKPYRFE